MQLGPRLSAEERRAIAKRAVAASVRGRCQAPTDQISHEMDAWLVVVRPEVTGTTGASAVQPEC
jgi:hypothetical protein